MDPALSRSRVHCHACGHRGDTHFTPDDDAPPPTCPSCSSEAVEILDHEGSGYHLSLGMIIDHIVERLLTPALAARAGAQREGPVPRAILDGLVEVKVREAGRDRDDEPDAGEAFTVEGESACPVCHAGFHAGEGVVELPCLHAYHKACLQPWLARVATCPVCRARVVA